MKNSIIHPTKSDFLNIKSFTDSIVRVTSVISKLNNFIDLLKRIGDTDRISIVEAKLSVFLDDIIETYFKTLKDTYDDKEN